MDNENFVLVVHRLAVPILKIVLELELELPEHLALEPKCTIWPWVSQRHSRGSLCNGSEDEDEFEFD
jgi:hypothetical protein